LKDKRYKGWEDEDEDVSNYWMTWKETCKLKDRRYKGWEDEDEDVSNYWMAFWKEACKMKEQAPGRSAVLALEEDNGPVSRQTQQTLIFNPVPIQPVQHSHLKRIISTNCCIHTVVPPDDGHSYARNM